MSTRIVRCLNCSASIEVEVAGPLARNAKGDEAWLLYELAARAGWQATNQDYKLFVCCPDCIPLCYDPNGRLGFLKDSCLHMMVSQDEELFMGIPDSWWDDPTWLCGNGHVSKRYLKSEKRGSLCLACGEPVKICAPATPERTEA